MLKLIRKRGKPKGKYLGVPCPHLPGRVVPHTYNVTNNKMIRRAKRICEMQTNEMLEIACGKSRINAYAKRDNIIKKTKGKLPKEVRFYIIERKGEIYLYIRKEKATEDKDLGSTATQQVQQDVVSEVRQEPEERI